MSDTECPECARTLAQLKARHVKLLHMCEGNETIMSCELRQHGECSRYLCEDCNEKAASLGWG